MPETIRCRDCGQVAAGDTLHTCSPTVSPPAGAGGWLTMAEADMFWDAADPEYPEESIRDICSHYYEPWQVAEVQQAIRLPNVFAVLIPTSDSDDDDCVIFATRAEAEAFVAKARAAALDGGE